MDRVVLDTNVIISAALSNLGNPADNFVMTPAQFLELVDEE